MKTHRVIQCPDCKGSCFVSYTRLIGGDRQSLQNCPSCNGYGQVIASSRWWFWLSLILALTPWTLIAAVLFIFFKK